MSTLCHSTVLSLLSGCSEAAQEDTTIHPISKYCLTCTTGCLPLGAEDTARSGTAPPTLLKEETR